MEKFSLFEKQWTPHIIGELNGQYVKLANCKASLSGTATKTKMSYLWCSKDNSSLISKTAEQ